MVRLFVASLLLVLFSFNSFGQSDSIVLQIENGDSSKCMNASIDNIYIIRVLMRDNWYLHGVQ